MAPAPCSGSHDDANKILSLGGPIIRRAHRNQALFKVNEESRAESPKACESPKCIKIKEMRTVLYLYRTAVQG